MLKKDKSHKWQKGIAYIIETRQHSNLQIVSKNIDLCLPEGWEIWFFHSNDNSEYIDECCLKNSSRKYRKVLLKNQINHLNDYNKLLFSEGFWKEFTQENLLCFQIDTLINLKQKNCLEELCKYDYVGAPWSDDIRRRWPDFPELGGNGGFCFSKRTQRIKALSECSTSQKNEAHPSDYINEDIWFSKAFIAIKAKLPTRIKAQSLIVESIFSPKPFAIHKPWSYLSPTELQILYTEIDGLAQVHSGCITPLKSLSSSPTKDQRCYNDDIRRKLLSYARDLMKTDNVFFADQALQISHCYFPDDPKTLNLHAMLAFSIGAYEQALHFSEQALVRQPNFIKAQDNYKVIQQKLEQNKNTGATQQKNFLVVHSLGKGLAFDLLNMVGHTLLSDILNRKLIIFWGNNSCTDNQESENIYKKLFSDSENLPLDNIQQHQHNSFPQHWKTTPLKEYRRRTNWLDKSKNQRYCLSDMEFFNKTEKLIVSTEFSSILSLKPWIPAIHEYKKLAVDEIYRAIFKKIFNPKNIYTNKANEFIEQSFQNQDFIAIHLRAYDTDTGKKGALPTYSNDEILNRINQHHLQTPIFLITDDYQILKNMKKKYGSRVFNYGGVLFKESIQGYDNKTSLKNSQINLVETLVAQKAKYFYGSGYSHFDCCIGLLRTKHSNIEPFNLILRHVNLPAFL